MKTDETIKNGQSRRKFIGTLAATAGIAGMGSPLFAHSKTEKHTLYDSNDPDDWFKKIKGSHRIVYDASEPHMGFPFIWAWAYYMTNNQTGTEDDDMTAMVVLRHNAIPFAMNNNLWEKYRFGERFEVNDNNTSKPSLRNTYYEPVEGDFPVPGIDGIKAMQDRGALFCVCDLALTVYSSFAAQQMNLNPDEVKQEWVAGVLPDIEIVPSGVWALGKAQENGCGYIYAGG